MTLLRLALMLMLLATGARAHLTHDQVRDFVATADGRTVYVRIPLVFAFAPEIAAARASGTPLSSPHLRPEPGPNGVRYRVSAALVEDPAFRVRLAQLFAFTRDGRPVEAELAALRLHARAPRASLGTPEAARTALAEPSIRLDPIFGDAVLDLRLDLVRGTGPLGVRRAGPAIDLPNGIAVTNRLLRADGRIMATTAVRGQLDAAALFPTPESAAPWRPTLLLTLAALGIAALVGLRALRNRSGVDPL